MNWRMWFKNYPALFFLLHFLISLLLLVPQMELLIILNGEISHYVSSWMKNRGNVFPSTPNYSLGMQVLVLSDSLYRSLGLVTAIRKGKRSCKVQPILNFVLYHALSPSTLGLFYYPVFIYYPFSSWGIGSSLSVQCYGRRSCSSTIKLGRWWESQGVVVDSNSRSHTPCQGSIPARVGYCFLS